MKNTLKFKAIPLWEVITSFIAMLLIILGTTEFIIEPLTKGNTTMQTQFIIFVGIMLLIAEFIFHLKRSKNLNIDIDNKQIKLIKLNKIVVDNKEITNISITKFLFTKSLSCILIINDKSYLIYGKEVLSMKPDKEDIALSKTKIEELKKVIKYTNLRNGSLLNLIPKLINIIFYSILLIAFLLASFLFIAIFTDNTHWFDYFK